MKFTDKKGLFAKPLLESRVRTADTSTKEKIFGYLLGPVGALLFNTIVNGYINLYYTDVLD